MTTVRIPLIVSIDTECDKSSDWKTRSPVTYSGVGQGIAERLTPLFKACGIRPTYFLSPEVIAHIPSREILSQLQDCELATHLHGEYMAPGALSELAGSLTHDMQFQYSPEIEQQKLAALTELFIQQFGHAPKSFRAGRFGIGKDTGRWLQQLGYLVDSSVTPHMLWTTRDGLKQPDFRGCSELPYFVSDDGNIWNPGRSTLLEVPVTVCAPGSIAGVASHEPIWFRPWYSDTQTLRSIVTALVEQAERTGIVRPLVMMFHNVEVMPGLSPYPQTEREATKFLDSLKSTFDFARSLGAEPCTLSEYAESLAKLEQSNHSARNAQTESNHLHWQDFPKNLRLGEAEVLPILARHNTPSWMTYIYTQRASRWDVCQPCQWIAANLPKDAPILEAGCGVGFNLMWLAEQGFTQLYGFDLDPTVIAAGTEIAQRNGFPIQFWVDNGLTPEHLPNQKYTAVLAVNWIHLLPDADYQAILQNYQAHLNPEAFIIFDAIDRQYDLVPNNEFLTSDWNKPVAERRASEYKVRLSWNDIKELAENTGLLIETSMTESQTIPKSVYVLRNDVARKRMSTKRPRILLIADVPNWIFERHCLTIKALLSDEFDFDIAYDHTPFDESEYDLIYPLEWYKVRPADSSKPEKYVTGIRSHLVWPDFNFQDLCKYLTQRFQLVHVVSRRLYDIFAESLPNLVYLTHGVDTVFFSASEPPSSKNKLRVGWAGNRLSKGGKGFAEIIEPLGTLPGIELKFCGYSDSNLTIEQMRGFYESIDVYLCASDFEGSNNALLEAAAMGRAIVTTDNGTVPEYLTHGLSALIVRRDLDSFTKALEQLRDDPASIIRLGDEARKAVASSWDWRIKGEQFRIFFRTALKGAGYPYEDNSASVSLARAQGNDGTVLLVCDYFWPSVGGVERVTAEILTQLRMRGYRLEVAARALPERMADHWDGILIHSLDAEHIEKESGSVVAALQAGELIASGQYKAVIMLADPLNWVFGSLAGIVVPQHTRVIAQPLINDDGFRLWQNNRNFRDWLRSLFVKCDFLTTLTNCGCDTRFLAEEGLNAVYIPNATNAKSATFDFRSRHGIDATSRLLLMVGRIDAGKQQAELVKNLQSCPRNWVLIVVGPPGTDPNYVEALREALKSEPRARWLGLLNEEEIAAAMQAADLLLLPSKGEVSPLCILEAMSHRLAWIATPESGSASENSGGLIVDFEGFPEAIARLLQDDPTRHQLGNLGYQHWLSDFRWDTVGSAWSDLVEGRRPNVAGMANEAWGKTDEIRKKFHLNGLSPHKANSYIPMIGNLPDSDEPLVSIIVPTYNRPELLQRSIKSILGQTYKNIEIIVLNDAGCPVENIIRELNDQNNIVYAVHAANSGLAAARNTALRLSRGEYIGYLDDDDTYKPEHIENMLAALKGSECRLAYCNAEYLFEDKVAGAIEVISRDQPYAHIAYSREQLLLRNFIPVNAIVFHRALLANAGYFDESLGSLEDWDWLLRASEHTDFISVPMASVEVHTRLYDGGHMLARQRPNLQAWYEKVCAKYPVSDELAQTRQQFIKLTFGSAEENNLPSAQQITQDYKAWLERQRPSAGAVLARVDKLASIGHASSFHAILVVIDGQQSALADTLDSLAAQCYPHWHLSVLSPLPCPDRLFEELPQLHWQTCSSEQELPTALQACLADMDSDWIWILKPGDRLEAHALLSAAEAASTQAHWQILVVDDDEISQSGEFQQPRFKPEFNVDLLRSTNYLGSIAVRRTAPLKAGELTGLGDADIYDLALQILDYSGPRAFGHISQVLLHRGASENTAADLEQREAQALNRHLQRSTVGAVVDHGFLLGTRFVTYQLPDPPPLVSILIPTKDRLDILKPCLESILEKTQYPNFEILVIDNQSQDRETHQFLQNICQRNKQVRVLNYPHAYNFAAINNFAANLAKGDFLVFLNNDTAILQEHWLAEMVRNGLRPEVGAVGARLVYPNGTIQHAGVILGMGALAIADHWHIGAKLDDPGYMNRLQVAQNVSAVTAACLLMRKDLFVELGGFDAEQYQVLYNDVDLCLRIRESGRLIVWTPRVTVMHHGSSSLSKEQSPAAKQRSLDEVRAMLRQWLPQLGRDPAFSPHLSLRERAPTLETVTDVPWSHPEPDRLHIFALPLDSFGIGEYRMRAPLRQLSHAGHIASRLLPEHGGSTSPWAMTLAEVARAEPDVIFLQEGLQHFFDLWNIYRDYTDAFLVYSQDDLIFQLPATHPMAKGHNAKEYRKSLRKMLALTHRLIVGTEPMAEAMRDMIGDIRVVPNRLEWGRWGSVNPSRNEQAKPRVGWAGGVQHAGDLAWLLPVVEATAKDVDWIFFGMCPDAFRPHVAEFHQGVPFDRYPEKLAALALDLAVAPLAHNNFNRAKSNLRLLEYGALGWPVICSDITPYQHQNPPVTRLANQPELWIRALRERLADRPALASEGEILRAWVLKDWILEDHLEAWLNALTPSNRRQGRGEISLVGQIGKQSRTQVALAK